MIERRPLYLCPLKLAILAAMIDDAEHTSADLECATNGNAQGIRRILIELQRDGYVEASKGKQGRFQGWKITVEGKVAKLVAEIPQLA